jgi:ubiquinone biosynthesis protein COQ9
LTARRFPAKRQRIVNGVKILLDIARESSDWFPPLKAALGCVNALIKHYEVFVERMAVAHN